jgi:hypothetical protein
MALHADIRYETPNDETCGSEPSARSVLRVRVQDTAGAILPAASVYAALIGATDVSARLTDQTGTATFDVPQGAYAVTAVMIGFAPRARGLALRGGCSGAAVIGLEVGPVIDVER